MQSGTTPSPSGTPVSNDVYDVIAVIHEKLEGLSAMRQYMKDGNPQLWQQVSQLDTQAVQMLSSELERMIQAGQLHSQSQPAGRK